jgi:hypothetical protein
MPAATELAGAVADNCARLLTLFARHGVLLPGP